MEERDKRFELIRIAVSLADYDVIDLQIKHLRNFSTDPRLHEILQELEQKNFRQALFLMKEYVSASDDAFFASVSDEASAPAEQESESPTQGLFDLDPRTEEGGRILGLDDMLRMTRESAKAPREYASESSVGDFAAETKKREGVPEGSVSDEADPLFALDRADDTQEAGTEEAKSIPDVSPSDTVSDVASASVESATEAEEELFAFGDGEEALSTVSDADHPVSPEDDSPLADEIAAESRKEKEAGPVSPRAGTEQAAVQKEGEKQDAAVTDVPTVDSFRAPAGVHEEDKRYAAFAYMGQKYRNMLHQYPQAEISEEGISPEAQRFIEMVSTEDYTESQVEAAIARYQELRDQGRRAEAAQMLIAAATTESVFAQFMLARELFKGEVLERNHPEAFTQINHLAEQNYPEAICDLGQLYEYGIGIDKNKRHALLLYEEAAEMGVERARHHYERLRGTNPVKALTSLFRRKKHKA